MTTRTSLLPRLAFAALTGLTGALIYGCLRPPHPVKTPAQLATEKKKDRTQSSTNGSTKAEDKTTDTLFRDSFSSPLHFLLIATGRTLFLLITTLQALYIASFPDPLNPTIPALRSPAGHPLNPTLLTPNRISVPALLLISAAAILRLRAFASLGTDFTFDLRVPGRLNTAGLYAWVQHPSYVGAIFGVGGASAWFIRCDGVLGTVLPGWVMMGQGMWNHMFPVLSGGFVFVGLWIRVREEEEMLRGAFGREWEEWHARTARFVPFVL